MKIKLPAEVRYIISTLEDNGFDAYVVGGCVRDSVAGTKPKDWDICTNALPEQSKDVFGKVLETGIKHGTVTLIRNKKQYEITTFRADGKYSDNRHPDSVSFVSSLKEDLSRRDFTCNALAYNPKTGPVDLFGGIDDIKSKTLRCVGEADGRFREDALRIMRALRFASSLGYSIEESTSEGIHRNKELLRSIAPERISAELGKLLAGHGAYDVLLQYSDVLCVFIPEIEALIGFEQNNPYHHLDVWEHTALAVSYAPQNELLRLTMLLHDIAKPGCYTQADGIGHFYGHPKKGSDMARDILNRLRYDKNTINTVAQLVLYHDSAIKPNRKIIRRWLNRIGNERLRQLIEVRRADISAHSVQGRGQRLEELNKVLPVADDIIRKQECFSLKDLAVNGRDLIAIGITDGVLIGKLLSRLLAMVIDGKLDNGKETLLQNAAMMAAVKTTVQFQSGGVKSKHIILQEGHTMSELPHAASSAVKEIPPKNIHLKDRFFAPYSKLVREVMLPYQWDALCDNVEGAEKSHSIENIRIAAGEAEGEFQGMIFQDSDVAKWLEAVAYSLQTDRETAGMRKMEENADEVIRLIGKAQCDDGYFNTYFQLKDPDKRFTNLYEAHELYCLGHFIEAAVAYAGATGKTAVLDIFRKYADLADSIFGNGKGKRTGYPGHQEIELALARLFEATGEERYLKLAKHFLDERGTEPHFFKDEWEKRGGLSVWSRRNEPCPDSFSYNQAHKPVREQTEAVGHAVRAVYMYTAMAEIGRLTNDESLITACRNLFNDICCQMYVTGGIGSTNHGEAFTFAYDLPNDINYSETCASIGLIFFMQSMLKTEQNSVYADVMERALYNTVPASISTDGKSYFYVNPMEVWPAANEINPARRHVAARRQKWHKCACCPPNAARMLASLERYLYLVDSEKDIIYFNLYTASEITAGLSGNDSVSLSVKTDYPLDGAVCVTVGKAAGKPLTLAFRLPQWYKLTLRDSREEKNPAETAARIKININGKPAEADITNGYAHIKRNYQENDKIEIAFDMPVKMMRADTKIRAGAGKVCLQRGPLVYCLEQCDNDDNLSAFVIDTASEIKEKPGDIGGMPCIFLTAKGYREEDASGGIYSSEPKKREPCELTFAPYHLWGNRSPGEMFVWIREA